MSETIKSVSVKIGADTKDFISGLKKVDYGIRSTVRQGNALEKSLAIKFDGKHFAEAQKLMQKALEETTKKAESIRDKMRELEKAGKIDSIDYETLNTELIKTESSATVLEKKLEDISKIKIDKLVDNFKNVGKSVESVGKALLPLSGIAAGIGVGIIKAGKDTLKAADDIATSSQKYTMSSKAIQYWQFMAMQSDVPADRLFKASSKVRDAFGSQMTGEITKATDTLKVLGININNFGSSEDAFKTTIESLSAMKDKTLQAKYANEIFGEKIATDLLPLFAQGEDAIKQYNDEFEKIGYMTDEQVNAFAELDNEFNKIGEQLKQTKYELGVALLPVIKELTTFLTESVIPAVKSLVEWFGNLPEGSQKAILSFIGILAIAAPLIIVIGKMIGGIGTIISILPKLGAAIKLLGQSSKAAMVGGIAALAFTIFQLVDLFTNWNNFSGLEKASKILGIVATAAIAAAFAFAAFHSAWSFGIAAVGIVAGLGALVVGFIAAKDKMNIDSPDPVASDLSKSTSSSGYDDSELTKYTKEDMEAINNLKKPYGSGGGTSYEDYTNNSVSDMSIVINIVEPNATADEIADKVSKAIALKFATRS